MKTFIKFIRKNHKGTDVVAPIAKGITIPRKMGTQCQCDCQECAGGDTTDDR
jgi:hypothetical protein